MRKTILLMRRERILMKNEIRNTTIITTIICLIPMLAGVILYNKLPDQIAIHWGANGEANGWAGKFVGIIVLPGILVLVNLIVPLLLKTDPKYSNISGKTKKLIQWIIPVIAIFASSVTLAEGLGVKTNTSLLGELLIGVIFTIIGNYLPKMSQSYTVGIKLPWTLADEENWDKTHRFAGRLWVVCGVLMIISAFLPVRMPATIVLAAVMVLVPTVYSYMLYMKNKIS